MKKQGNPVRFGITAVGLLAVGALISACGSNASPTPAVTVTATVTAAPEAAPSPTATTTPTPAAVTATGIVDALVAAGLPVTAVVAQTESTDPNSLLGRPRQYTERVSFDVPGGETAAAVGDTDRGGVVELWLSPAEAQARADYIQSVLKGNAMLGAEYDYVHGSALLRLTGKVLPSVAEPFQVALTGMP